MLFIMPCRILHPISGVSAWWETFKSYIARKDNITDWRTIIDQDDEAGTDIRFRQLISDFLFHQEGANYKSSFQFSGQLKCGEPAPPIVVSVPAKSKIIVSKKFSQKSIFKI